METEIKNKFIAEIPKILSSSNNADKNMADIISKVNELLGIDTAAIYYISEEYAYLKYPLDNELFCNFEISIDTINQLEKKEYIDFDAQNIGFPAEKYKKLVCIPLKIRNTVFGFIAVVIHINSPVKIRNQLSEKSKAAHFCAAEFASYLLPRLKRLLKRSTRPPVSTSFCLPV